MVVIFIGLGGYYKDTIFSLIIDIFKVGNTEGDNLVENVNMSYLFSNLLTPFAGFFSLCFLAFTFKEQRKQTVNNTFNLLLEQHQLSLKALSGKGTLQRKLTHIMNPGNLGDGHNEWMDQLYEKRNTTALNFIVDGSEDCRTYLRVFYRILKFIDDSNLNNNEKMNLAKLLRAFVDNHVLLLIALNAMKASSNGKIKYPKYKYYIERYNLLEHLEFDNETLGYKPTPESIDLNLLNKIITFYKEKAFGDGINKDNFIAYVESERLKYHCNENDS